jgi:hypothetical protein
MGLLDADRFEGRPREGARKIDVSDLMRRLTDALVCSNAITVIVGTTAPPRLRSK